MSWERAHRLWKLARLLALVDLKRNDDALALARRLKAPGQPDAVRGADQVNRHIESGC